MSANPSALMRLWDEFQAVESDVVLGGIYANKSGYHNTRENHLRYRPSDYSIQLGTDKRGPSDKASAIDLTFDSARGSDFRTIAKYSKRLLEAFRTKDKRLYHNGKRVWREFYGNADLDREVEGWTLYDTTGGDSRAATSDSSHLWHIHLSCHREFVENWEAVKGILDILLGKPIVERDWLDMATKEELQELLDLHSIAVEQKIADRIADSQAATVQALNNLFTALVEEINQNPGAVWVRRIPNVAGTATASAADMLSHARSNSYMSLKQYEPLMEAIRALAPSREVQAEIVQLKQFAISDMENENG